jgi:two-component system LytT family sensor kinase
MPSPNLLRKTKHIGVDHKKLGDDPIFETDAILNFGQMRIQFIIISAYIFLELFIAKLVRSEDSIANYALLYLLDIVFFYFNLIILLPRFYIKGKSLLPPLLFTLIVLLVHFSVRILIFAGLYANYNWISVFKIKAAYAAAIWRSAWIFGLSAFYWDRLFIIHKVKKENILLNAYYHARISPHLLFNSLNFAYADNDPYSKGGKMLVLLGEFARYSMSELPTDGRALLSDEIKQLNCLIRMNELRFPKTTLEVDIANDVNGSIIRIPPQIIVSLAENLFKYADLYSTTHLPTIAIWKDHEHLHIHMENAKIAQADVPSHKIGLRNVSQRLKNIYGRKYILHIDDDQPDFFKLDLSIPL